MYVLCPVWLITFRSTYMRYKHDNNTSSLYIYLSSNFSIDLLLYFKVRYRKKDTVYSSYRNNFPLSFCYFSNVIHRQMAALGFSNLWPRRTWLCSTTPHVAAGSCCFCDSLSRALRSFNSHCTLSFWILLSFLKKNPHRHPLAPLTPLLPTYNTPSYGGAA